MGSDSLNQISHEVETPWASAAYLKDAAIRLAHLIGKRLHTFYPNTLFRPDYPAAYDNIYIDISQQEGNIHIRIHDDGEPPMVLTARLDATESLLLNKLATKIATSDGLEPDEWMSEVIGQYGAKLYEWLGKEADQYLQVAWANAQNKTPSHGLRLRLGCDASEIAGQAWEYLSLPWLPTFADNFNCKFVAQRTDVLFSRYLSGSEPRIERSTPQARQDRGVIRSLTVVPTVLADELSKPNIEDERRRVEWGRNHAMASIDAKSKIGMSIDFLPSCEKDANPNLKPTWDEVRIRLDRPTDPPCIFHFIGHGVRDNETDSIVIIGNSEQDGQLIEDRRDSDELLELLSRYKKTLRLIILQSCNTAQNYAQTDHASQLANMAQKLAAEFACVIGMQHVVQTTSMHQFAYDLYLGLGSGRAIDITIAEARRKMFAEHRERRDWGSMVLYLQIVDNLCGTDHISP